MKRNRMVGVIAVLVCAALSRHVHAAAERPTRADPAMTLAKQMQAAVTKGDVAAADALFDMDTFIDRTATGVSAPADYDRDFRAGIREGGSLLKTIVMAGSNGTYRLLRIRQVNGETRALFRLLPKDGGLAYHDWVVGRDAQGKPKFIDFYVAVTGEFTSQTLRRVYVMGAVQSKPTLLDRLTGADKEFAGNLKTLMRLGSDIRTHDFKDVLDGYKTLPKTLQENKTFMIMRLAAAQNLQEQLPAEYSSAMADFQRLFPGDPAVDLTCLDATINEKKYDAALQSLDRMQKFTGGDAYVDFLAGNVYLLRAGPGDFAKAKALYRKSIDAEPTLAEPYWGMTTLSLKSRDFDLTAAMLDEIHQQLGLTINNVEGVADYAEFVKSPAYKKWKAAHAK